MGVINRGLRLAGSEVKAKVVNAKGISRPRCSREVKLHKSWEDLEINIAQRHDIEPIMAQISQLLLELQKSTYTPPLLYLTKGDGQLGRSGIGREYDKLRFWLRRLAISLLHSQTTYAVRYTPFVHAGAPPPSFIAVEAQEQAQTAAIAASPSVDDYGPAQQHPAASGFSRGERVLAAAPSLYPAPGGANCQSS
jgi:hypothetical protein